MRREFHPFLVDPPERRQTEHLIPAAVGQDGPPPVHERVETPCSPDNLHPGTKVQMVRVAEDDPRPQLLQLTLLYRFYRPLGPHRHENGCGNLAVTGQETTGTRSAIGMKYRKIQSGKVVNRGRKINRHS